MARRSAPAKLTREEKKAATRERLLDAAELVFARRGFAAASLDEIADEAGLTKGAVYSNFESKDDLIGTLLDERVDVRPAELAAQVEEEGGSAAEQAARAGALMMQAFDQRREAHLLAFEFRIHLARNPRLARRWQKRYLELRTTMARLIDEGAAEYGYELPLPADELAAGLMALSDGVVLERLANPGGIPDDLFGKMLAMIFRGIGGEPVDPAP